MNASSGNGGSDIRPRGTRADEAEAHAPVFVDVGRAFRPDREPSHHRRANIGPPKGVKPCARPRISPPPTPSPRASPQRASGGMADDDPTVWPRLSCDRLRLGDRGRRLDDGDSDVGHHLLRLPGLPPPDGAGPRGGAAGGTEPSVGLRGAARRRCRSGAGPPTWGPAGHEDGRPRDPC